MKYGNRIKRNIIYLLCLLFTLPGCGTVIPGPRYRVTVDEFSFAHGGNGVFYTQEDYRFYPLLLSQRGRRYLYLYERGTGRHRLIAESDAFSASPHNPLVLYAPEWRGRFSGREVPDFLLLDYSLWEKRGFFMPEDFKRDYLYYGLALVRWEEGGQICAFVNFYYGAGERPASWTRERRKTVGWRPAMWKVVIDPSRRDGIVSEAVSWDGKKLPDVSWNEMNRRKSVSPDGKERLILSRYVGHFNFNSSLAIERGGKREHIVKESRIIGLAQAGKYILCYIASAPVFAINATTQDVLDN